MRLGMYDNIDWEYIGALLANASEAEQAQVFRAFIKECHGWGTALQIERQLSGINLALTKEERQTLSMITYEAADANRT